MRERYYLSVLALVLLLPQLAVAQEPQPPENPPPLLETVISLPPITLQAKGKSPRDVLAALAQQTGIAIYPFARATDQFLVSPKAPPWDFWNSRTFDPLDFDFKNASFWGAMRQVALAAGLGIDRGGKDVLINRAMDDRSLAAPGKVSISPLALCHVIDSVGDFGNGKGHVWMHVYVDPRVQFCSLPAIHIDSAMDDKGNKLASDPDLGASQDDCCWKLFLPVKLSCNISDAARIAELRGYVPIQAVTRMQTVEIPLELGASKEAGPWTVKLEDFTDAGQMVGGSSLYKIFVGMESKEKSGASLPETLRPLVRLLDDKGQALAGFYVDHDEPKPTASGGMRQWIEFQCRLENGDTAKPAKLMVDVPLETKMARIPFEFKDISYDAENRRR